MGWQFPLKDDETLDALQDAYARLWAEIGGELQPIQIAAQLFPNDDNLTRACVACASFPNNPKVIAKRNEYLRKGINEDKSKEKLEARLWSIIDNVHSKPKEVVEASKELRALKGWGETPPPDPGAKNGPRTFMFREFPADYVPPGNDPTN